MTTGGGICAPTAALQTWRLRSDGRIRGGAVTDGGMVGAVYHAEGTTRRFGMPSVPLRGAMGNIIYVTTTNRSLKVSRVLCVHLSEKDGRCTDGSLGGAVDPASPSLELTRWV